ncbi:hypothetical protein Franean1_3126 [Parafrankia sp. EAN1pec]|nr:hypothetical protein Franean1_3126 [Frankia sp. EAN1pec]
MHGRHEPLPIMEFSTLHVRQGRPCPPVPSSPLAAVVDELAAQVPDRISQPRLVTEGDQMALLEALAQVPDLRRRRGVRHPFAALLAIAVCAMLTAGSRQTRALKAVTVPAGLGFPHAAQAIQLTRTSRPINKNTKKTEGKRRQRRETVYAICTLPAHDALPAELATWIRGHWSIEVRLRWVRDVTLGEDLHQARTWQRTPGRGHSPQPDDQPVPVRRLHQHRPSPTPPRPPSRPGHHPRDQHKHDLAMTLTCRGKSRWSAY